MDKIVSNVMKNIQSGSIILMHNDVANTPAALEIILKKLTDEGYTFVLLENLIYKEHYYIDHTGRQFQNGMASALSENSDISLTQ